MSEASPRPRIDRDAAAALIEPLTELVAQAGAAILGGRPPHHDARTAKPTDRR